MQEDINDAVIYQEMMIHPALFSHPHPERVAIIDDVNCLMLQEALKHENLTEAWEVSAYPAEKPPMDPRIQYFTSLPLLPKDFFDVMVIAHEHDKDLLASYFEALHQEGIILQLSDSPFKLEIIRELQVNLQMLGFRDVQIVSFPQPNFNSGWRSALMAKKNGIFRRVREKAIFNKNFITRYYNLDIHKASLVLPEFMREALTI